MNEEESRKITPPPRLDGMPYTDDEISFRHKLITPETPEAFLKSETPDLSGKNTVFRLPAYSHTMTIGNYNMGDLEAARLMFTIARVLESHGYYNLAIAWLTRIVDLNVTSLSYQAKLLTQLTTQHYGIFRKEEITEPDDERKGRGGDLMKKINELRMMERRSFDKSELGRF